MTSLAGSSTGLAGTRDAERLSRRIRAGTAPAKLRLLLAGLVAASLAWGAIAAWTVSQRASAASDVAAVSEPLSVDAQRIYRALSDADATAATAFLSGGLELEGFDIDMLHRVSAAIFGDPDKILFKAITDAQRIPAIESGAVDMVAHTMTITCERLRRVDFSTVYYNAGQRVLVTSGSRARSIGDLGGQRVCATSGSTSLANIAAASSHPVPVAVPYWTDCLVLPQQGDVAAISTDDSILVGLAAQDPYTRIVGPRFTDEPYGLAISKQHPEFVRFVNAVLDAARADGSWAASYARWIGRPVPAPPPAHYGR